MASKAQKMVDKWNAKYATGQPVKYWPITRDQDFRQSKTRSAAVLLGGHTAVVWVEDHSACVALSHVEPDDAE